MRKEKLDIHMPSWNSTLAAFEFRLHYHKMLSISQNVIKQLDRAKDAIRSLYNNDEHIYHGKINVTPTVHFKSNFHQKRLIMPISDSAKKTVVPNQGVVTRCYLIATMISQHDSIIGNNQSALIPINYSHWNVQLEAKRKSLHVQC